MDDVLIVGAGPAGSVAATILARAGVSVRLIDRARFPRDKLCGDTVNPGTLALMGRLHMSGVVEACGLRIDGMIVTGEGGVSVTGRYPDGRYGIAMPRRELDALLLNEAIAAGASFEEHVNVRHALVDHLPATPVVRGVVAAAGPTGRTLPARVVIAADGRRSALAFGLRLLRHPPRPKRWAIGAYFDVASGSSFGEMHIRRQRYLGVAPIGDGLTNVCLVQPWRGAACEFGDPLGLLRDAVAGEPSLRDRFGGRAPVRPPIMLGPLAVEAAPNRLPGLLLAGDAAGFIDPMTGDGLRFAVRGAELAAAAALEALAHGWDGVHERLDAARRREFRAKWRFNRALRALVASPSAVTAAGAGARIAPAIVQRLIARAGDCDLASAS